MKSILAGHRVGVYIELMGCGRQDQESKKTTSIWQGGPL